MKCKTLVFGGKICRTQKKFVSLQSILRCFANEGFGSAKFEQVRLCIRLALHLQLENGSHG